MKCSYPQWRANTCGLRLSNWPFDQQRFFASCGGAPDWRSPHRNAGKARAQPLVRSLPPGDRAPSMFWQTECQLFGAQALLNLMSNANKFTDCGTITIDAQKGQKNDRDWITVAVTDTGIGMTPEQMAKLFQ